MTVPDLDDLSGYVLTPPPKDGVPCGHPGCLSHVTHPCGGCGRVAGFDRAAPEGDKTALVWTCCGGVLLSPDEKCAVCGEGYDD